MTMQNLVGRVLLSGVLMLALAQAACAREARQEASVAELLNDPELKAKLRKAVVELKEIRDGTTDKSLEEQKRLIAAIINRVDEVVDLDNNAMLHKLQAVRDPKALQGVAGKMLAALPRAEQLAAKGGAGQPMRTSEPAKPAADKRVLGRLWLADGIDGLVVRDNIAYAAAMRQGLVIIDVSNPAEPRTLATLDMGLLNDVAVKGNYAYVAGGARRLANGFFAVVDISDPANPKEVARRTLPRGAPRIGLDGQYALLGCFSGGLVIFDCAKPTAPREISRFRAPYDPSEYPAAAKVTALENHAWGVRAQDGIVYLCDDVAGLRLLDFSDPKNPTELGRVMHGDGLRGFCNDVVVDGNYAYAAYDFGYLVIFDVSDKRNPREVGYYNPNGKRATWDDSQRIAIRLIKQGPYVLISQSREGAVVVVDVSNPARPREVRQYKTRASTWGLALEGDKLYAGSLAIEGHNWGGLEIFQADRPAAKAAK